MLNSLVRFRSDFGAQTLVYIKRLNFYVMYLRGQEGTQGNAQAERFQISLFSSNEQLNPE